MPRHISRGDRLGTLQDGADHAWRKRPLQRRAHPQCRGADEPRRPVRATLWADGAADAFTIAVLRYMHFSVAPAKAGAQGGRLGPGTLGSRLHGNDEIN